MYTTSLYPFGKLNTKVVFMIPMLLISMFTVISVATTQSAIQIDSSIAKLSPILLEKIGALGNARVNVLVETTGKDYSNIISAIKALGGTVRHEFKYVNALSATVPANILTVLAKNNDVVRIYYDAERKIASSGESFMRPRYLEDLDTLLTRPTGIMNSREYVPVSIKPADLASVEPANYWNPTATGTEGIWEETDYGEGSLVVIIDTGLWADHFMFAETDIIGGVDMSYDDGDPDYGGWSNIRNHYHGGHVAGIVASTGGIIVPPNDPLAVAIEMYTGTTLPPADPYGYPGWKVIWLLGMSPAASLYIVKVFDHTAGSIPESMVIAGMEHALDLKLVEGYDVDVISMSIGGPNIFDGRDVEDQLVNTITENGISVVVAAGNSGPASMTIESPGSAYTAISVGAAATPVQTRVFWDFFYGWPGIGYYLYTTEDIQVYAFSSRGPTSDGRSKPTLCATGIYVLSAITTGGHYIDWLSGTSMATPAVSGSVALLNAFAETAKGKWKKLAGATPEDYKQALTNGAVWLEGYTEWDQGAGYLNVADALEELKADKSIGDVAPPLPPTGELIDITNIPLVGEGTFTASITDLAPGHNVEFIFEITPATHWIKLDVTNVDVGLDLLGLNSFEVYIQSAKRTWYGYYVDSANVWGNAWFKILDDKTTWSGAVSGVYWDGYTRVIEPGYMRVVIENDWTSFDVMSGDIKITLRAGEETPDFSDSGTVDQGQTLVYGFYGLPSGITEVTLELWWENDWTTYPTTDLDMYIWWYDGTDFHFAGYAAATMSSPERITIDESSMIGLWIQIDGYGIFTSPGPNGEPGGTESWTLRIFHG